MTETTDYNTLYPSFRFDRPGDGLLRLTFDGPGLNLSLIHI